ncbi:MAG: RNA polymerase sigma factor, partial [Pyrinomonadaceae bacterium]
MLQPQQSPATHEAAFNERYERLRKSAHILTKQNQEQAEDLLHDAFVQFLLSHPDLQSIQNLDGYLYRVLRNMRVSQMRRAARLQEATLTMAGSSLENILSLPDHSSLE